MKNLNLAGTGALALALLTLCAVAPTADASIQAKAASTVSLAGPVSVTYGATATLSGVVSRRGTATRIAGASVQLQRSPHGKNNWTTLRSARTASTGRFAFAVTAGTPSDYRVRWTGSATYFGTTSRVVYPAVAHKVIFDRARAPEASTGETVGVSFYGRTYPKPPMLGMGRIQRWNPTQRQWVNVGVAGTTGYGTTSIDAWAKSGVGRGIYRLWMFARGGYAAGYSKTFTVDVYARRPLLRAPIRGGASGASASNPWRLTNVELGQVIGRAEPRTARWVDVNTATCRQLDVTANIRGTNVAPVMSVTAGDRTLYAARLGRDGSTWRFYNSSPYLHVAGLKQVRITVTNLDSVHSGEVDLIGRASCYS